MKKKRQKQEVRTANSPRINGTTGAITKGLPSIEETEAYIREHGLKVINPLSDFGFKRLLANLHRVVYVAINVGEGGYAGAGLSINSHIFVLCGEILLLSVRYTNAKVAAIPITATARRHKTFFMGSFLCL